MATERENSTSEVTSNQEIPVAGNIGGTDSSGVLPITSHKLNGHNFLQWSQSVLMFVRGKGKDDHLTGLSAAPAKEDSRYQTWRAEDSMVMSWLINYMTMILAKIFSYIAPQKRSGMLQRRRTPAMKIPPNFLVRRPFSMIYNKVNLQSPITLIFSPVISSN